MKKILTILFGLVVLPMTCITSVTANDLDDEKSMLLSNMESNPSADLLTKEDDFNDFTLNLGDISTQQGQQVCIPVTVSNFTNILGMEFRVNFDPAELRFDMPTNLNLVGLNESTSFGTVNNGSFVFSWFDPAVNDGITVPDGTVIMELCFTALVDDVTSEVFVSNDEITDSDQMQLTLNSESSMVTVGSGNGGGGNTGNFTINLGDVAVQQGQQVCIPVTVSDFNNILGMEFRVNFDPAELRFDMPNNLNLVGLNESTSFGTVNNGSFVFSWFDPAVNDGVTVPDGTVIMELCFTALVNNVASEVFLSNDEITDSDQMQLTLNSESSIVTVGSGSGGGNTGDFTINLEDVTVQQGQQVCIPVNVSNFNNILGMEFRVNFDPAELRFDMANNLNLVGLNESTSFGTVNNGSFVFSWFDPAVNDGVTVPDGTVIMELCFTALVDNVASEVFLSNDEITDSDQMQLTLNSESSIVTVGSGNGGGGGDFEITMADATVDQGEAFCLDVSVTDFTNLSGMGFDILYDANSLNFTEIRNLNLVDLTQASFGVPGQGANQPGAIALSWNVAGANDVTVPDGTVIFQTCFEATNSAVTSQVTFDDLEAISGLVQVPSNGTPGTVTIDQTNNQTDDFTFTLGNVTAQAGEKVCVPLSVDNFDDIAGLEFTLDYDPNILAFDEIRDFGISSLNISAFGTPGQGTNQPGSIKASWFDQTGNGEDLPDGSTLVNFCFDVIGSGSTVVSISDSELLEVTNNSNMQIPVELQPGTVTIEGIAPTTDLQIIFSMETAQQNEAACVEVSVNNFDNVLGMQYVMTYDPTILRYDSLRNLNLDQLSAGSFGEPGVGINQPGFVTLSWFDQTIAGVTVPDGTAIFEMCFTALPEMGSSPIAIDRSQDFEVIDVNEDAIPNQVVPGVVNITTGPPLVLASPAVITAVNCNGGNDGAIDISISGGSGSYAYAWNFQNATTEDLNALPAGSYTVTVTDNTTSQTLIETFTVSEPATTVTIDNVITVDVNCTGENTGSIQVIASGGTGTLSYTWNANLSSTANQMDLVAGTYEVTVTDTNLCTDTSSITIAEPASALAVQANVTPATCTGIPDASITLVPSGGTQPYDYMWGNGLTGNVATQTNIDAGDYAVTVTDANNCTIITTVTVGSNPAVAITALDVNFIDNGNDGALTLDIDGGSAPFTYQWTGPNNFSASSASLTNLAEVGEYCITVTDANGCTDERCVMLLEQLAFDQINITNACAGSNTGSIDLSITGGMAPYTYNWDNNASSEDLNNLSTGDYAVTVTDALGNTFNGQFPVGEFSLIFILGDVNNVTGTETNNNGSITLNPTGGTPGYTYQWSNGATSSTISNLTAGTYDVTVTDQNGCTNEASFEVEVQLLPLAFSTEKTDVLCNGERTGSVSIEIVGGAAPYGVSFSDGMQMSTADGMVQRSNLPAGELVFVITDATNTTLTGNVMIEETDPIAISNVTIVHDSEEAGCTGRISLELTGGTPGYSVQWNSPNTGMDIIGLCEGNYVPSVVDASGCRTSLDPIVVTTFRVGESVQNVDCAGDQNGSIQLNSSGGSGQNTYNWTGPNGQTIAGQDFIENLAAGTYTVTVTESSGNTITKTINVGTSSMLAATVSVDSDYRGFGVSCADATDGSLSVNASNGTGELVYSWMQGENAIGEGTTIDNLGAGNYVVEVMDESGCLIQEEVSLVAPAPIEVTGFVTDPACVGDRNGSITVVASGGVGAYSYNWNTQVGAPTITGLTQGRYTVTVTDQNNCQMEEGFDIQDPAPILVTIESTPATDGCNGVLQATVNGGTGPYVFRWNSNAGTTDPELTNLCPGNYAVVVADNRGCSTPGGVQAEVLDRRFPCMDIRSVISPDGDGLNDEFFINCIEEMSDNRLMIFNRIGQLVFEADNYNNDWMGTTMNGEELPEGAYYYVLEFTDMDGNFVQTKGSITLLRGE